MYTDKPEIKAEEVAELGLDEWVDKNLDAHGYAEHNNIRMPIEIGMISISSRYVK